jgi:hypothetical protein
MTLSLPKKESTYSLWYKPNKERVSAKRKKRYAEDPEYRQCCLEASRRYRRGERSLTGPPSNAPISFAQAAERIGRSRSALDEWRRKKLFPEPKRHNGRLWFTEQQVLLLMKLKEVIRMYGNRRGKVKQHQLNEAGKFIHANWD